MKQEERGLACPDCLCARDFLLSYNEKYQSFLATCSVLGTLPLLILEVFTLYMPTWAPSSKMVKAQWSEQPLPEVITIKQVTKSHSSSSLPDCVSLMSQCVAHLLRKLQPEGPSLQQYGHKVWQLWEGLLGNIDYTL